MFAKFYMGRFSPSKPTAENIIVRNLPNTVLFFKKEMHTSREIFLPNLGRKLICVAKQVYAGSFLNL